ncbi:MAG: DUF3179 domain-containing protein [Desulfomonile tiedjei]|uniref:DUF3179 domain-containing protein n=1 Tax=Desulfomonile tiedjei TaxID=2358 RepID=A0A9D6Z2G8_9BACT|nr:DUF3179 domain-containing protein [Desulfomonile tiedjei]
MAHTGVVYARPKKNGEPFSFGVSGKLWRDSLVMYDRSTLSLWSQVLGQAVAGPLEGMKLEQIPSEVTAWAAWKERHPDTLVLVKPAGQDSAYAEYHRDPKKVGIAGSKTPDARLPGKTLVFGMILSDRFAAAPFPVLDTSPVLNNEFSGIPIVIFSPAGENAAMAFERTIDGKALTFEHVVDQGRLTVRDIGTGSTWSWESGECLQGPFKGKHLKRIPGMPVYWAIWARFHPDTELISREMGKPLNE